MAALFPTATPSVTSSTRPRACSTNSFHQATPQSGPACLRPDVHPPERALVTGLLRLGKVETGDAVQPLGGDSAPENEPRVEPLDEPFQRSRRFFPPRRAKGFGMVAQTLEPDLAENSSINAREAADVDGYSRSRYRTYRRRPLERFPCYRQDHGPDRERASAHEQAQNFHQFFHWLSTGFKLDKSRTRAGRSSTAHSVVHNRRGTTASRRRREAGGAYPPPRAASPRLRRPLEGGLQ